MSLLFKETFNQYPIGHNLIGSGNMDWTLRHSIGTLTVDSNKWRYCNNGGIVWNGFSQNHLNISNMGDGTIIFHPKQIVTYGMVFLYHYSSLGGYHILWLPTNLRVRKFVGWNPFNSIEIANWDALNVLWVYEMEIRLIANQMQLYLNNNFINSVNDTGYPNGTIGLSSYQSGFKIGDICVFDNNSLIPVAPTNLTLTILNANSIKLNFDNLAFNADFISIERKNGISGTFLEIDRAPGNARSYIDRYCQPGNDYYYQVRAVRL